MSDYVIRERMSVGVLVGDIIKPREDPAGLPWYWQVVTSVEPTTIGFRNFQSLEDAKVFVDEMKTDE